jgi:hypothetical protein
MDKQTTNIETSREPDLTDCILTCQIYGQVAFGAKLSAQSLNLQCLEWDGS